MAQAKAGVCTHSSEAHHWVSPPAITVDAEGRSGPACSLHPQVCVLYSEALLLDTLLPVALGPIQTRSFSRPCPAEKQALLSLNHCDSMFLKLLL